MEHGGQERDKEKYVVGNSERGSHVKVEWCNMTKGKC